MAILSPWKFTGRQEGIIDDIGVVGTTVVNLIINANDKAHILAMDYFYLSYVYFIT